MAPGYCRTKVHQLDTLGIGGRRVLVSRQWSGKTLADHRWDQRARVRNLLAVSLGHAEPIDENLAARIDAARAGGFPAPRGNSPDPTTPTSPTSPDGCCGRCRPGSNTGPSSQRHGPATRPATFRQPCSWEAVVGCAA
jgi:hypothetical protein